MQKRNLTGAVWRKSTRSGGNSDMCVEVAYVEDVVAVRDSKDPQGPALQFTREAFGNFVAGIRQGDFE